MTPFRLKRSFRNNGQRRNLALEREREREKPLDEKRGFIAEWERQEESLAELCRRYEISRQTGYKWLERYHQEGESGLEEHSRAPLNHPQAIPPKGKGSIGWSAKSVSQLGATDTACLSATRNAQDPLASPKHYWKPASAGRVGPSTQETKTDASLHRAVETCRSPESGLVRGFQGWFLTQDGSRCDPLTITDACSRYLLRCCAVKRTDGEHAWAVFEAAFREFGLPEAIRTDTRSPFASRAPGGLSQLSMLWLRLGHERIEPGQPQQAFGVTRLAATREVKAGRAPGGGAAVR